MNKKEEKLNIQYSKDQITNSKKYIKHIDLLQSILDCNEYYTIAQVDKKIENFMKRKV